MRSGAPPEPSGPGGNGRLAIVISTYYHGSSFIRRELEGLRARGISLDVYALRRHPDSPRDEALVLPYILSAEVLRRNIRRLRRPGRYLGTLLGLVVHQIREPLVLGKALVSFPKAAAYADRILESGVRHVHAHWAGIGTTAAWVIERLTGIPYSFTGHAWDLYFDDAMLAEKMRRSLFVITCTGFNRDYLERRYPEAASGKVRLSYHGLDLMRYAYREPSPPASPFRVLAVGRRTRKKGFEDLLRACRHLGERGHRLLLRIVGWPGESDPELQRLAMGAPASLEVRVDDAVAEEELIRIYREADVFVAPSVVVDERLMDGIPNVLLEAMALGVPAVATAVSGIPEVIRDGETGWLVPPRAPGQLAEAIAQALSDTNLARDRARRARALIEADFDIRKNSERLARLFRSVAET
ncbi:MAG: glycosyltransferase family 4 protein [Acidobacteriota bacterium]|jgi:glycosyltransferase involved in cell wall biosynthesis